MSHTIKVSADNGADWDGTGYYPRPIVAAATTPATGSGTDDLTAVTAGTFDPHTISLAKVKAHHPQTVAPPGWTGLPQRLPRSDCSVVLKTDGNITRRNLNTLETKVQMTISVNGQPRTALQNFRVKHSITIGNSRPLLSAEIKYALSFSGPPNDTITLTPTVVSQTGRLVQLRPKTINSGGTFTETITSSLPAGHFPRTTLTPATGALVELKVDAHTEHDTLLEFTSAKAKWGLR